MKFLYALAAFVQQYRPKLKILQSHHQKARKDFCDSPSFFFPSPQDQLQTIAIQHTLPKKNDKTKGHNAGGIPLSS